MSIVPSLRGLCRVYKNPHGPARFTGNHFRWIAETPDGKTFCDTREAARGVCLDYRAERRRLLREGMKAQAATEFRYS